MKRHRADCRHSDRTLPCLRAPSCDDCTEFQEMGPRVLLILRGRLGDVVMATSLVTAFTQRMPGVQLTWLTDTDAAPLIQGHPDVERVLEFGFSGVLALRAERFDLVVNLDRSPAACALTMELQAARKSGFGYSQSGAVIPLDAETDALFDINRYPDRRAVNRRSWADLHQAIAGLGTTNMPPPPSLHLDNAEEESAIAWRHKFGGTGNRLILCSIGSHAKDPQKRWPLSHWLDLWARLMQRPNVNVIIHAGPDETELHAQAVSECPTGVHDAGVATTLREAMTRIRGADAVITADSLALHLAMALDRAVVGLFGPTNPAFVQSAAKVELLWGKLDCPPCHSRICHYVESGSSRPCLKDILPETVEQALDRLLVDSLEGGFDAA